MKIFLAIVAVAVAVIGIACFAIRERETAFRETAEKLYEQLVLDSVSDAKKQAWLYIATSRTASSYECLEPVLAVYDKVYKNYGIGDGIFSWNRWHRRQQQNEQK